MGHKAQRRHQILEAAERLLAHYGMGKTTVADIAREAGVGVGTVYLEFSSKDEIIVALSRHRHTKVLCRMREATEEKGTYLERVQALLLARVEAFLELAQGGMHAAELVHCGCSAVEEAFGRFREEEHRLLAEVLREGMEAGEFIDAQPEQLAHVILEAFVSFSPPWVFRKRREELLEGLLLLQRVLFHGLLSQKA